MKMGCRLAKTWKISDPITWLATVTVEELAMLQSITDIAEE